MSKTLDGKIALVTGASRGLGRAIAERLGRDGALVAVHYGRSKEEADGVVGRIKAAGGDAFAVQAEIGSVESIGAMFAVLDKELSTRTGAAHLDILVNNAGIAPNLPMEETDEETFDRLFDVNVKGVFFVTKQAISRLRDGGRIVNISSGLSRGVGGMNIPAYSATKGAVDVLTRQWAVAYGGRGITVNSLAPGAIDTDMNAQWLRANPDAKAAIEAAQALKRVGQPEDIGDAVAFLAGPDGRWVTGQYIEASGGWLI